MFTIAAIVGVAFAAPPVDKSDMSNEIVPSGGFVTKNGDSVSASWGGFEASASLADDGSAVASAGGNGLGAGAGYGAGGAGASAGVYGTGSATGPTGHQVTSGGYGNGGKPGANYSGAGNNGGFFDRIFAIPINVLQSVNTYLNQKQGQPGQHSGGPNKVPEASVGADYGHQSAPGTAGATGEAGHGKTPMMVQTKPNYDQIFNIPITALRSVQNLLNG